MQSCKKEAVAPEVTMTADMFGGENVKPLTQRTQITTVCYVGGRFMLWACFAASRTGAL